MVGGEGGGAEGAAEPEPGVDEIDVEATTPMEALGLLAHLKGLR